MILFHTFFHGYAISLMDEALCNILCLHTKSWGQLFHYDKKYMHHIVWFRPKSIGWLLFSWKTPEWPKSFNELSKNVVVSSSLLISPPPLEDSWLMSNMASCSRAFMMLELLPHLAKRSNNTCIRLDYVLTLLIFGNEFSMVSITRKGGWE